MLAQAIFAGLLTAMVGCSLSELFTPAAIAIASLSTAISSMLALLIYNWFQRDIEDWPRNLKEFTFTVFAVVMASGLVRCGSNLTAQVAVGHTETIPILPFCLWAVVTETMYNKRRTGGKPIMAHLVSVALAVTVTVFSAFFSSTFSTKFIRISINEVESIEACREVARGVVETLDIPHTFLFFGMGRIAIDCATNSGMVQIQHFGPGFTNFVEQVSALISETPNVSLQK